MAESQIMQVRLPDGARPAPGDVELLCAILEAIATLTFSTASEESAAESTLTADGWDVVTRLRWVAEARRGTEFEEVTGASKAEALEHLQRLVQADRVLSAV